MICKIDLMTDEMRLFPFSLHARPYACVFINLIIVQS